MKEYIDKKIAQVLLRTECLAKYPSSYANGLLAAADQLNKLESADVVEVDKVAEMLRLMFDDDCACNYNGNDEWLPLVCEHEEECPMPKERLCCWKQFVKHFLAKMDGERKEQR